MLPKENDAVLWYNIDHNEIGDDRTMHGGLPVEDGERYAINIWQCKLLPNTAFNFENDTWTNNEYVDEQSTNYNNDVSTFAQELHSTDN